MTRNYTAITERPGLSVTPEQLAMAYTRYNTAARFCEDKDVLEVACGPGFGLGYLAKKARRVVAGDVDEELLNLAQQRYRDRTNIDLRVFDAHQLPFEDYSFDVVILFEAIYYLAQPEMFLDECHRVLRKNGVFLLLRQTTIVLNLYQARSVFDISRAQNCLDYFTSKDLMQSYLGLSRWIFHPQNKGLCHS